MSHVTDLVFIIPGVYQTDVYRRRFEDSFEAAHSGRGITPNEEGGGKAMGCAVYMHGVNWINHEWIGWIRWTTAPVAPVWPGYLRRTARRRRTIMSDRWEIREKHASPRLIAEYGPWGPTFQVWDTAADRLVAFGQYDDRERAQARIDRMDPADHCTGCSRRLDASAAITPDCPTPEAHRG
jgi:hypothetical protein